MAEVFGAMNSTALLIGGTSDHIHCLSRLSRTVTIAGLVEEVKKQSSRWIKTQGREYRSFHWQRGYGAFSIG
jgi:REP element-mobilizing transposase RayT